MHGIILRTFCTVMAVALLFAGLVFALDRRHEHGLAVAEHDGARRMSDSQRQAADETRQALIVLDQARDVLNWLEPVPRKWTSYPLTVKTDMDTDQAMLLLRLLGKTDAWTFLRTEELTLRSTCGVEPCATFQVDLQATAHAPVANSQEPAWPESISN